MPHRRAPRRHLRSPAVRVAGGTPNDTLILSEAGTSSVSSFRLVDNSRFAQSANAGRCNVSAQGVAPDGQQVDAAVRAGADRR
jgi:hypothetical protein